MEFVTPWNPSSSARCGRPRRCLTRWSRIWTGWGWWISSRKSSTTLPSTVPVQPQPKSMSASCPTPRGGHRGHRLDLHDGAQDAAGGTGIPYTRHLRGGGRAQPAGSDCAGACTPSGRPAQRPPGVDERAPLQKRANPMNGDEAPDAKGEGHETSKINLLGIPGPTPPDTAPGCAEMGAAGGPRV